MCVDSGYLVYATPHAMLSQSFFKLYRCFCHGLKICMWFGYNPQIICFSLLMVHIAKNNYTAGDINFYRLQVHKIEYTGQFG